MKPAQHRRCFFETISGFRRALLTSGGLLVLATLAATPARGQSNCRPWGDIPEYKGTVTVSSQMTGTNQSGTTRKINESVTYTFDATYPTSSCSPVMTWVGQTTTLTASIDDITLDPCGPGQGPQKQEIKAGGTFSGTVPNAGYFNIAFQGDTSDLQPNTYTVQVPQFLPGTLTVTDCNGNQGTSSVLAHYGPNEPQSRFVLNIPLPTPTAPLQTLSSSQTVSDIPDALGVPLSWNVSWTITPVQNFDVQVAIPNYVAWRPTGGVRETDAGTGPDGLLNTLLIQARLVDKTTQLPVNAVMDMATFTLTEVSREPGVALNWPAPRPVTPAPDMSFDPQQNPAIFGYKPSPDGTSLVFDPTVTGTRASGTGALLSPHDWGGWATLNVTITVAGTDYPGHLVPLPPLVASDSPDILLPARQANSHIADSWKSVHGAVGKPDGDDSENNPTGDGQPGDGFTLYEEYRGFYMGCSQPNSGPPQPEGTPGALCQHVEGDPQRKDLFIVELIPADPGIELLKAASGLNVHYRGLALAEVSPEDPANPGNDRVINFNHSQGAHNVDQHAIVIEWGGTAGLSRVFNVDGFPCGNGAPVCPALPKHIDHIDIDPKFRGLAEKGSVQRNFFLLYTSTIAHEIAHSLDVYHHGGVVDHDEFWTLDPKTGATYSQPLSPENTLTGIPTQILVLAEDQDPSSPAAAKFDLSSLKLDQALSDNPLDPSGKPLPGRSVYVGNIVCSIGNFKMNGEHSGDQDSFMRYDLAQAYIPNGFPTVRFWTGGNETPGSGLTDHPVGTGVNDPARKPRPRYGDADTTLQRGNDRSQLDVNDSNKEIFRAEFSCP
jgi:hypothetical protein